MYFHFILLYGCGNPVPWENTKCPRDQMAPSDLSDLSESSRPSEPLASQQPNDVPRPQPGTVTTEEHYTHNCGLLPDPSLWYVSPLDHLAINANVMPVINFSCCLRTQCASIPGIEYAGNSDYWCAHSGTGLGRFHFKSGSCYFLAHTLWGATCPSRALAASAVQWGEY